MPPSSSPLAYRDVQLILDEALASERGIDFEVETAEAAFNLSSRMYYYRERDREQNRKIYPPDHPKHGRSVYDTLSIRKVTDGVKIFLRIATTTIDDLEARIKRL